MCNGDQGPFWCGTKVGNLRVEKKAVARLCRNRQDGELHFANLITLEFGEVLYC